MKPGRGLEPSRWTEGYLWGMALPYLLFTGFGGYGSITAAKAGLFALLTGVFLVGCLLWGRRGRLSAFGALLLLHLGLGALSTALSLSPLTSLVGGSRREGLVTLAGYSLACLCVSRYARPRGRLLVPLGVGIGLCSLVALLQLFGLNPLGLYPAGFGYGDNHLRWAGAFLGTVGNADLLAAVNALAVAVLATALWRLRGKGRVFLALPLLLTLWVMVWDRTAAGLVGVLAGLLVIPPVVSRRRWLWLMSGGATLLGLGLVFLWGDRLGGTVGELHALLHGQAAETFGSGRLYIWQGVLALVPERPLLGGGPDTLLLRGNLAFERLDPTYGLVRNVVDAAHNEYLDILVHRGALGLLTHLALLGTGLRRWCREAHTNPAVAISGAGVFVYAVQAFFGISSLHSAPFYWLCLGVLMAETEKPVL